MTDHSTSPTPPDDAPQEAAPAVPAPADGELFDQAEVADAPRIPHPLKPVVEALIFASPEPITIKAMTRLLDDQKKEDVEAAVAELQADYQSSAGLQLVEVAGGYQIVTRPELYEWVRRLFKERTTQKLSVQALETLAVIAYKQPVTAAEISEIRGVTTASGVLSTLLDRRLIKIVGRKQVVGRPFMYGTTREFLDKFGLKDLSDLPKVEDMSEALGFDLPTPVDEEGTLPLDFSGGDHAEDAGTAEPGDHAEAAAHGERADDAGGAEADGGVGGADAEEPGEPEASNDGTGDER
jgi:segregation and condensation protein B